MVCVCILELYLGIAIQENIMEQIAREVNLDPANVRLNNLVDETLKKHFTDFLKDTGNYY